MGSAVRFQLPRATVTSLLIVLYVMLDLSSLQLKKPCVGYSPSSKNNKCGLTLEDFSSLVYVSQIKYITATSTTRLFMFWSLRFNLT